jgi:hypothetical protein
MVCRNVISFFLQQVVLSKYIKDKVMPRLQYNFIVIDSDVEMQKCYAETKTFSQVHNLTISRAGY